MPVSLDSDCTSGRTAKIPDDQAFEAYLEILTDMSESDLSTFGKPSLIH
jgi:hypothetical protein